MTNATVDWAREVEETTMLRQGIAEVLAKECGSRSVHDFINGKSSLDKALWRRAADLGWLAVAVPERGGGLGLGLKALQVLHTELGRRAAPGPFIPTLGVAQWLVELGAGATVLPAIAAGEIKVAGPLLITQAKPLKLTGSAVDGEIDVLGSPDADLAVVPVGEGPKIEGWALVRPDAGAVSLRPLDAWDRTRGLCALRCADAPALQVFRDGDGAIGRRLQRHMALAVAADSLGGAAEIARLTINYLKTRIQFDGPIASFQSIKHRAADLVASIAAQEHLLDQAVETANKDGHDADLWAALAKAGATECFAFVSGDCIQLHGGVGHTWEFDAHIYAKRARLNQALAADNRAMRDFAAEALAEATLAGRETTELAL